MAEIINLRQARKSAARAEARATGAANAAKFGRSKAQKTLETREAAQAFSRLDGHRRDHSTSAEPPSDPNAPDQPDTTDR